MSIATVVSRDASMKGLEKLVKAVQGDDTTFIELITDTRQFIGGYSFGLMSLMIISNARWLINILPARLPATVEIAVSAIVILVALIIGILIMTQIKGTVLDVATAANDTDAVDLVNTIFQTGKSGLIILALSTLVLGAATIIAFLRGVGHATK
ncbi:hypothetical protein ACO3UB_08550 (plasmid) [Methanocaldococcus sp. 16A]